MIKKLPHVKVISLVHDLSTVAVFNMGVTPT